MNAKVARLRCGLVVFAICAATGAPAAGPTRAPQFMPRSESGSRQFIVFANDHSLRGAMCSYAEDIRQGLQRVFGRDNAWRHRIAIVLREPDPAARDVTRAELRMAFVGGDIVFQIDVTLGRDFDPGHVRPRLVAALMMETAVRRSPAQVREAFRIPAWLVEGACGLMDMKAGRRDAIKGFAALVETGQIPGLSEFLRIDPAELDSASAALYRSFSTCLLKLLIDLPGGRGSLDSYLSSIPTGKVHTLRGLLAFFPSLGGSEDAAQRWWKLGVARQALTEGGRTLGAAETLERLEGLLTVTIADKTGEAMREYALSDYRAFAKKKSARAALSARLVEVSGLASRAHPLIQPVVAAYAGIYERLRRGDLKRIDEDLERVEALGGQLVERAEEIEDYLNWYEATSIETPSDAFTAFFAALRELEWPRERRSDAVSMYLDRVENETAPSSTFISR